MTQDLTHPKVSIIILNWNGGKDTLECVESVEKITYPNYEVVIVDNGSTDGSWEMLKSRFHGHTLMRMEENLGFTGGANAGIKKALASGAEYVLLLNNDTVVDTEFVGELVKVAEKDNGIGALCSKIYFYDRPGTIQYAGAWFNAWLGWGRLRGYNQHDDGQFDVLEETERPTGCSMMVTKEFCEKVGLLDEEYFSYAEDMDWGMRAGKAGFKIMYVPVSRVWHKESKSTGGAVTAVSLYYSVRNILRYVDKNSPLPFGLRFLRYLSILMINLSSLFSMRIPKTLGVRRIYQGFRDYFQGNFGEFKG